MSSRTLSSTSPCEIENENEIDVADHCAWWVLTGGYATRNSNYVHLPKAIRSGEANDPDTEPPAETLCYIDSRKDSTWKTKPHVMLPVGYRKVCTRCMDELEELCDEE